MHKINKKKLDEFKQIFKEKYNHKYKTDEEAEDSARKLLGFMEILVTTAFTQAKREKRLEKKPKGFPLESTEHYSCLLCRRTFPGNECWWDKYGTKCLDCQKAIDKRIIPKKVLKNRKLWVTDWEIKDKYGIHPATREKMIREKELDPRRLKNKKGEVYFRVYLLRENHILKPTLR